MNVSLAETNEKWRKRLLHSYFTIVIIIAIVEFVIFFFDEWAGLLFLPKGIYFIRFFVAPSVVNFLMVFVCRGALRNPKRSDEEKNRMVGWLLAGICMVTQVTHYVFGPILCTCGLPIFMSCVFGDQKLSRRITLVSFVALFVSIAEGMFELRKGDNQLFLDAAVAVTFYICCYLTARILISKYASDKELIQEALQKQIALLEQTRKDPLTNLYNRKTMFDNIALYSSKRQHKLWLAVFDMDNFKRVNDTYGHAIGDKVLCYLASILKDKSCEMISAYRFGGEEFALLFVGKEREMVCECLEDIRYSIEQHPFEAGDKTFHVTLSIGLAEFLLDGMTIDEFFSAADFAMYTSKQKGKNRITVYEIGNK